MLYKRKDESKIERENYFAHQDGNYSLNASKNTLQKYEKNKYSRHGKSYFGQYPEYTVQVYVPRIHHRFQQPCNVS